MSLLFYAMSLPEITPHVNGQSPASPKLGEAFVSTGEATGSPPHFSQPAALSAAPRPQAKTVFPQDTPSPSIRTFFYNCTHYYFAGLTIFRWFVFSLFVLTAVAMIIAPIPWFGSATVGLIVIVSLWRWRTVLQKQDFVRFEEQQLPSSLQQNIQQVRLDSSDKIPVHVTGYFEVEDKSARLTWLPGFYRTFATREHALLCQLQISRFLKIAETDAGLEGMWYIFFQPAEIENFRWGSLHFGSSPRHCIAIDRKIEIKAEGRFKRDKTIVETFYITFGNEQQGCRIWLDLHAD